nr:MAG TPA: hypothetical protein [Caudoviricetes sp.]DAT86884.1 MAG TPA: hypothetical protein [Caudoviricetes sp.]DAW32335.1 MAG TPA: hypothetical protein [Caudoviricetes sp.]DAW66495.1 MAG TPA: hypothetical protein [Caudoviricetes sp.]
MKSLRIAQFSITTPKSSDMGNVQRLSHGLGVGFK